MHERDQIGGLGMVVIGSEGVGNANESGMKLLEFCSRNGLCIVNLYITFVSDLVKEQV